MTPADKRNDEKIMALIISQCDTLDITRFHEMKNGEFRSTTIFDGDVALLRAVKYVAAECEAAAIERCEKVCLEIWHKAPNDRPEYRQNTISHGCKACADAIAKLREWK